MEQYRKLDRDQLGKILDEHELWVESLGQIGNKADLTMADLSRAELGGMLLDRADLGGAQLAGAGLGGVKLRQADLSGADLTNAVLKAADLTGAILAGARLAGADLRGSELDGADFEAAELGDTKVLNRAQLARAGTIDDYSGFSFEEDELDLEGGSREKRAETLFDPSLKGRMSFAVPSHLPPWRVARVLGGISDLAEGVRLALTADFNTPGDLAQKADNPALWTGGDENTAARLSELAFKDPIEGNLEISRDLGQIILDMAAPGGSGEVRAKAASLDRSEERLELAARITLRGMDKLKSLLGSEDAKFSINGVDMNLRDRES